MARRPPPLPSGQDWTPQDVVRLDHPSAAYLAAMDQLLTTANRHGLRGAVDHADEAQVDPELDLDIHLPNCVGLRTRAPNTENKGRVDLRELVRQSIRMAGSFALVGEVRGPESWDLLKLCQIGMAVLATVHGYSCQHALHRLAELALEGASQRGWQEALQLVASTVGVVVQLQGPRSTGLGAAVGHHRVVQVYEVLGLTPDRRLDPEYEPEDEHGNVHEPVNQEKVMVAQLFKDYRDAGLLRPNMRGEQLFWTARHSHTVELTPRGRECWWLVAKNKL